MTDRTTLAVPHRGRIADRGWVWAATWLAAMLAAAFWVLRPAPSYVAPTGWRHVAETGPVLDVLAEGDALIAAGRNGVARVDADGTARAIPLPGFSAPPVSYALARDGAGRVWLGHETGISVRDAAGWTNIDTLDGEPLHEVRDIAIGAQGAVFLGTGKGVWRIAPPTNPQLAAGDLTSARLLGGVRVLSLIIDAQGGIWAGTTDGLFHLPPDADAWESWTTAEGLPNRQVAALMQDRDGRVWVGTGFHDRGGTLAFEPGATGWGIALALPADLLAAPKTRSFFEDRSGALWLGTETDGFSVIAADLQTRTIVPGARLPSPEVTSIGPVPGGGIWLGTLNGLVILSPEAVETGLSAVR